MASNKNQHFVPRCHLREFSIPGNDAAICLYNIDRRRFIELAPIKHQCSRDYFYGKDDLLEEAIQSVEREYSSVVRAIKTEGYSLSNNHKNVLKKFWLMQNLRTEAAAQRAVTLSQSLVDVARIDPAEFNLEIREAVQMGMMTFARELDAVSDLKVCLVRNKTRIPFVTSDNPAIITNRWHMANKRRCGLSFGMKSSGAIALLPISPTVMCVGYDGDVYGVSHVNGWVETHSETDVEAYNQHQFINCLANVYVHDKNCAEMLDQSHTRWMALRPEAPHRINFAIVDEVGSGYTKYAVVDRARAEAEGEALMHMQRIYPEPSVWPRQISWRSNGAVFTNGTGVGYLRREWARRPSRDPFRKERP